MTLALLLISVFIGLAYVVSAGTILSLAAARRPLARAPAGRRTQLYWIGLLMPLLSASVILAVVLLPSLLELAGLWSGHCREIPGDHVHLCFRHFSAPDETLPIVFVGALVLVLTLSRTGRSLGTWIRDRRALASLVWAGRPRARPGAGDVIEFDSELPVCVTLGSSSPRILVSTGAIRALGEPGLGAALAHERAHIARGDDRALLIGRIAALFHLPFIGRRLLLRWQQESELVCDAFAAERTGNPADVADAILRVHRALLLVRTPSAMCAGAPLCQTSDVLLARRVHALLEGSPSPESAPHAAIPSFRGALVLFVSLAVLEAPQLHHALESALGLMGVR